MLEQNTWRESRVGKRWRSKEAPQALPAQFSSRTGTGTTLSLSSNSPLFTTMGQVAFLQSHGILIFMKHYQGNFLPQIIQLNGNIEIGTRIGS